MQVVQTHRRNNNNNYKKRRKIDVGLLKRDNHMGFNVDNNRRKLLASCQNTFSFKRIVSNRNAKEQRKKNNIHIG